MGFKLDMDSGEGMDELSFEKPSWLNLNKGETVRVTFLDSPYMELVYDLRDKNAEDGKNYRGTYRSLMADTHSLKKIKALVGKDPEGELTIDAKTLGEPTVSGAVPVLVYPTDVNGRLNKEDLKSGHFKVKIARLSQAKYRKLEKEVIYLRDEDKGLSDVDFLITLESDKRFPTWEFKVAGESLFKKHKDRFESKVKALLKEEYDRLGVADIEGFNRFLAQDLTPDMWAEKLVECGYHVSGSAVSSLDDDFVDDETQSSSATNGPDLEDLPLD